MAWSEHPPGPFVALHEDRLWAVVWTGAVVAAIALHAVALAGMRTTPERPRQAPITMAIAIPPEPEPPPPEPQPEKPKPKPKPETPAEPLPPAPPTEAPPTPPDAPVPQAAPDVVAVAPSTGEGVAVPVGAVGGDPTAPPVSGTGPTDAPPTNRAQPGPAAAWDENGYKTKAWDLMNKGKRYPRKAQVLGLEGKCILSVRVNHDGSLAAPPNLLGKGTGHAVLDEECLAMAQRTRFEPIPEHVAAPVAFRFPIEFVLENR